MSGRATGGAEPHPRVLELTERVLGRAVAEDWPAVGELIGQIYLLGHHALLTLLYATADAHILADVQRFGRRHDNVEVVMPVWLDSATGRIGGADDVPPPPRWAGRFAAARAAGDRQQCEALLKVLAGLDTEQFNAHVAALVEMCAAAVRLAPCTCGKHT